jgi:DHA1 family inner membrane transport protein
VPLGTALGNAFGWRASFWVIAVAGAAAMTVLVLLLPPDAAPGKRPGNLRAELAAAVRPVVLLTYAIICLFMFGTILVLGYIVPILTELSGVAPGLVPWVLFGMGFTGFFGNLIGGRLGDWNAPATMLGILCLVIVLLLVFAAVATNTIMAVGVIWTIWFVGFGFVAPARGRIIRQVRDAPNFASTLISTAFNLGIAIGSAIGGAAIAAGWGYGSLPLIDAAALSLAAIGTLLLGMLDRRAPVALTNPAH